MVRQPPTGKGKGKARDVGSGNSPTGALGKRAPKESTRKRDQREHDAQISAQRADKRQQADNRRQERFAEQDEEMLVQHDDETERETQLRRLANDQQARNDELNAQVQQLRAMIERRDQSGATSNSTSGLASHANSSSVTAASTSQTAAATGTGTSTGRARLTPASTLVPVPEMLSDVTIGEIRQHMGLTDNPRWLQIKLSTPAQSPRPSPTSSDRLVQDILNATGVTDNFADFNLNPAAFEVPLPPTPSDASSLDTVELDLQDQFELYEQLLSAHTRSEVHRLSYQDRLYLLEFAQLGLPSPTEPSIAPIVVPAAATTVTVPVLTMSTPTVIIADRNYSIAKLQGQDDYQVWRIQMEDMFQDVDVWDIVSGTSARPSTAGDPQTAWDKKNKAALGALRRRVDTGPMIHVARADSATNAWTVLKNQYQSLGIAAMTMLRNRFTSLRMNEGDDLESHIKELRKIFNDLNIALLAESSDQLKEIEFVRQLLVSLPESWQLLVSIIPQRPESGDTDGSKMSIDVQSRLLAEYHRRKSLPGEKSFFARNRQVPGNRRSTPSRHASAIIEIICYNCGIPGHKKKDCRKAGGGGFKGGRNNNNNRGAARGRGNNRRNNGGRNNRQGNNNNNGNNNNQRRDDQPNNANNGEHANFASSSEFAFLFASTRLNLTQFGIGLDNAWIIDSGASCHVTNRREHLANFIPMSVTIQGVGGNANISGFGEITLYTHARVPQIVNKKPVYGRPDGRVLFTNVALVEDSLVNLLSLSTWTDEYPQHTMHVVRDSIAFFDETGPNIQSLFALAKKIGERRTGNSWYLMATTDPGQHAYLTRTLRDWHIILAHTDPRNILRLKNSNLARGLDIAKTDSITLSPDFDCLGCVQGKAHARPFGNVTIESPREIADLFYSDVWGPASINSIQGNRYYIVFVDAATRFTFVHFMRQKSEAVDRYIALANFIRTQKGREIKRIHFDNGKELINSRLREFCDKTGTEITTTAPYSSQQNGPAERAHRTLAERSRAMIHGHSNTRGKLFLWQEAVSYANMIANNMPHKIHGQWRIPQIEMFNKPIDMSYFQLFGSTCHVLIQSKPHSKIDAKTRRAIFTGIDRNSGGVWRYLAWPDRAIRTSRNVYFPRHLPNPTSFDSPAPLTASTEPDSLSNDKWIQVFAPSEGEMGHGPDTLKHQHISTQHEDLSTQSQGEPSTSSQPAPAPIPAEPSPKLPTSRSDHTHRPAPAPSKSSEPSDRLVPGDNRRTTRKQAKGNSTPFEHFRLNQQSKPERVLWFQALNSLHDRTSQFIRDPDEVYLVDVSSFGHSADRANLPGNVQACFLALDTSRDDELHCYTAWAAKHFSSLSEPHLVDSDSPKWSEALKSDRRDEWIAALDAEFAQLKKQKVYEVINRSDVPRELRLKARLVLHGNRQIAGLTYNDYCHMVDVTGAYTHAPMDIPQYVEFPEGYGKGGPKVMLVKQALYGSHQAGHLWELFRNGKRRFLIICYVDDFVICCTRGHIEQIKREILNLFDCKDLGETRLFLGIAVSRDRSRRTLSLTMESYIKSIVKLADLEDASPAYTPMSNTMPALEPSTDKIDYPYITQLGRLFWVTRCVRPDIAFPVGLLARFSNSYGLTYDGNKPFYEVAYSDSDFATQHLRKSISGCVIILAGAAVCWLSKRQNSVALSTMEAETVGCHHTARELIAIRQFLDDIGIKYSSAVPSPILCDNQAAIESAHNPTNKPRTKHIDVPYNFVRDEVNKKTITVSFIPSKENLADAFTKALNYNQHWYLANSFLGIHERRHADAFGQSFPHALLAQDLESSFVSLKD
ncbi:Copia protein [Ceratobasidium sp. AG-Ba]|nr:Copia protein [Ceratobasidium sp. AG-Ba]